MIRYDEMPERMRLLPRDDHGRPYPWFVAVVNGKRDFRVADGGKRELAVTRQLCWVCGQGLGSYKAFLIGPMCAVNRTTAEPPCHRDCAIYSAMHCDFLVNPVRGRREIKAEIPRQPMPGHGIMRNPGVALVWITKRFKTYNDGQGEWLIQLGDPVETLWFAQGRAATREEVMASIDSGLPILREMAEEEGNGAVEALTRMHEHALEYLP